MKSLARLASLLLLSLLLAVCCLVSSSSSSSFSPGADGAREKKKHHILLATPCYGGLVTDAYHLSVVRSYIYYQSHPNVQLSSATVPGIADLPKARGALIYQFLQNPTQTHILFVDADIEFAPEMLERFASSGHDAVTGIYPKKAIHWDNVREHVQKLGPEGARALDMKILKAVSLDYPIEFEFEDDPTSVHEKGTVSTDKNGFARVRRAGAGFMMVSRKAIETMVREYPELAYVDPPSGQTHWAFFHTVFGVRGGKNMWVSEDFAFCDRWQRVSQGEGVWVDLTNGLNHIGPIKFEGSGWLSRYILPSGGDGGGGGGVQGVPYGQTVREGGGGAQGLPYGQTLREGGGGGGGDTEL